MAVPDSSEPVAGAIVKRTQLNYIDYQIWQRTDDHSIYMMPSQHEDMLDGFKLQVHVAENGMFYAEGIASRLYIRPLAVQQNELTALHHLAKLQWV